MRRIVFFNIPAHGHTNPTLPVVRALTDMGHEVVYYSFGDFRASIEAAGARFMGCDGFDAGDADGSRVANDILASTALIARVTLAMDEAVTRDLRALEPDVIVADSVAFWGKLFAQKLGIPYVCSNTTFAFNKESAKVMGTPLGELLASLIKLPLTGRLLKPLRDRGYPAKNGLSIVQNDEDTPTVVYTSKLFQPCAETFPDGFSFVGPCLRPSDGVVEKSGRPMVYVSVGTVLGGQGDFFRNCVRAFDDGRYDVTLSVGAGTDIAALGTLPENIHAYPRVDQLAVLRAADVFVTHCGMNSASEGLWFGVPLVTRPLTREETGVANRVEALGAGLRLEGDDPENIRRAVDAALTDPRYREGAKRIGDSFRACGGADAAARAILRVAGARDQ